MPMDAMTARPGWVGVTTFAASRTHDRAGAEMVDCVEHAHTRG